MAREHPESARFSEASRRMLELRRLSQSDLWILELRYIAQMLHSEPFIYCLMERFSRFDLFGECALDLGYSHVPLILCFNLHTSIRQNLDSRSVVNLDEPKLVAVDLSRRAQIWI
jgi:hypothetical protein